MRAKFYVYSVMHRKDWITLELTPVFSNDPNHENKKFWDATPSGKIEISAKPEALESFKVGDEYYIDFTPA